MAKGKSGPKAAGSDAEYGSYMVLNGQRVQLQKHDTDFSVQAPESALSALEMDAAVAPMSPQMTRASAPTPAKRDRLMDEVRKRVVAHHIYEVPGTGQEIVIDDHVIVTLRHENTGELEKIMSEFALRNVGRMGDGYVLQLTPATNSNPVKVANRIAERPEVESAAPQVMMDLQFHDMSSSLLAQQWYLSAAALHDPDVIAGAGIDAPEAWTITRGDPEVVVAVIDDGFDLGHPAFDGVKIHEAAHDFVTGSSQPLPSGSDYHGTSVASIAVGAHKDGMRGIAPGCTFLPLRVAIGLTSPQQFLFIMKYASQYADVLNCSFGLPPTSFDAIPTQFREEITKICESGGRRGKGLVMVVSAGNDDAPTFMDANDNKNGISFVRFANLVTIPPGNTVYSGYPMTPGVIAVSAMSSLERKSGYSCWGPHVAVAAPSNNEHYMLRLPTTVLARAPFVANYRGLGQIAAINRPGQGSQGFAPVGVGPVASLYTNRFGGTSGAAPVVTGVAALMLSVNPDLSATQVRQILMDTADKDVDVTLDCPADPNIQGLNGQFVAGRSLFFGAGKVNAFHAVRRASALRADNATSSNIGASFASAAAKVGVNASAQDTTASAAATNVTADPSVWNAVLLAGGSLAIRGDVPPTIAMMLAQSAGRSGASLVFKNPLYPPQALIELARAGNGHVTFDFS